MLLRAGNLLRAGASRSAVRYLSATGSSSGSAEIWDWVPPTSKGPTAESKDSFVMPVVPGANLIAEEVRQYLESQGGENSVVIEVNGDLGDFKKMVIASGRSTRHIRKMTQSIVAAMKERRLKNDGVEGDADDDWQLVNCKTFLVHVMLPKTRRYVDLESHWTMPVRPSVPYAPSHRGYEESFMQLLEQYPCPDDYIKSADIASDEPVVKEF